jgi:hypothetical protein
MTTLLAAGRAVGTGASEERKPFFSFLSIGYGLRYFPSTPNSPAPITLSFDTFNPSRSLSLNKPQKPSSKDFSSTKTDTKIYGSLKCLLDNG